MKANSEFVPFARPAFDGAEEDAVLEVLRSGWLTTGKHALEFEKEFASFSGARRSLAVNSATSGLHLALEAIGVHEGCTVVTCPYTFAATANVARQLGAEIAFCDSSPHSPNLDVSDLEKVLDRAKNPVAVIPVHVAGLPCDMPAVMSVSRAHGCRVVEDAAHAFPSRAPWGFAGTAGDVGVFSFYATKTITTGEGGMVVTGDDEIARRVALMRSHGIDREVWSRYTSDAASWYYEVREAGYKYNLPDILAAIGRVQLGKADAFLAARERVAAEYDRSLSGLDGISLPPRAVGHSWHLYQLRVEDGSTARDSLARHLSDRKIGTSVHFIPLHLMPYYATRYSLSPSSFPNALSHFRKELSLPIYPSMADEQVDRVVEAVREWAIGRKK